MDGHPSDPHRRDISDAGSRWNGLKPSDIGRAINGPIRRQRRHDVPAQSNKGKPSIHIIPPSPPHGARPCSSRNHREIGRENQHHPSSERSQAAIDARGNLPITRSTDDEGWFQLPHTVTPPREQAHHSRASDTPSINWIGTTPYRLSFDLKPSLQGGRMEHNRREGGYPTKHAQMHCGFLGITEIQQTGEEGSGLSSSLFFTGLGKNNSAEHSNNLHCYADAFILEGTLLNGSGNGE